MGDACAFLVSISFKPFGENQFGLTEVSAAGLMNGMRTGTNCLRDS